MSYILRFILLRISPKRPKTEIDGDEKNRLILYNTVIKGIRRFDIDLYSLT